MLSIRKMITGVIALAVLGLLVFIVIPALYIIFNSQGG